MCRLGWTDGWIPDTFFSAHTSSPRMKDASHPAIFPRHECRGHLCPPGEIKKRKKQKMLVLHLVFITFVCYLTCLVGKKRDRQCEGNFASCNLDILCRRSCKLQNMLNVQGSFTCFCVFQVLLICLFVCTLVRVGPFLPLCCIATADFF